jgi:hypothetical protein
MPYLLIPYPHHSFEAMRKPSFPFPSKWKITLLLQSHLSRIEDKNDWKGIGFPLENPEDEGNNTWKFWKTKSYHVVKIWIEGEENML